MLDAKWIDYRGEVVPNIIQANFYEPTDTQSVVSRLHRWNQKFFYPPRGLISSNLDPESVTGGILTSLTDNNIQSFGYGLTNSSPSPNAEVSSDYGKNFKIGGKLWSVVIGGEL